MRHDYNVVDRPGGPSGFLRERRRRLGPSPDLPDGAVTYWGTDDVAGAVEAAIALGATRQSPVVDVGGGIVTGSVTNPMGMIVGFIDNPYFGG